MTVSYDGTFEGLLTILAGVCRGAPLPDRIYRILPREAPDQGDLFGFGGLPEGDFCPSSGEEAAALAEAFFELSAAAYDSFLCGWMSELSLEAECIRFGGRLFSAARAAAAGAGTGMDSPEARRGAERAATDRGIPAVRTVLDAAYKVRHETDRLLGFLRFRSDTRGTYMARCAPDHFVLPRLAGHFSRRFGDAPWLIIDEKRGLCLVGDGKGEPRLLSPAALPRETAFFRGGEDPWEELWRTYHGSINNPLRKNPGLQRQFMPARYWKYLPEMGKPR
ncbi:TIGR03915 family putative DNA repair protein [Treponema sp. TIM-1]|uniref:TIGR03915 family putative DNA repair protein n=1 Tax=Treponema sp. TIM-1 TaxID=2898417 RepID=UPI00397F354B